MRKTRNILAGIVLSVSAGIFLLSIVFRVSGIYYNNTPSFPVGFYKIVDVVSRQLPWPLWRQL